MSVSINFHDAVPDTLHSEAGRVLQRHANGVPRTTVVTIRDSRSGSDIAFYFSEAAQAEEIAAAFQRAADLLTGAVVEDEEGAA